MVKKDTFNYFHSIFVSSRDDGYPDYRQQREDARAERRRLQRESAKAQEQAQEEIYDRMMNPHLYGEGGGGERWGFDRNLVFSQNDFADKLKM